MRAEAKQCADCELRGKTSTTVNLGAGLVRQGYAVLAVDFDPQANLTMALGFKSPDEMVFTVSNMLEKAINEEPIDPTEGILTSSEGVDLMPSNLQLGTFEQSLSNEIGRESMLRQFTDVAKPFYDYILIDCSCFIKLSHLSLLLRWGMRILFDPNKIKYHLSARMKTQKTLPAGRSRRSPFY